MCRLLKVRLDKEEFEEELKELQGRVSSMKQQIPDPSHAETLSKVPPPANTPLQTPSPRGPPLTHPRADYGPMFMQRKGVTDPPCVHYKGLTKIVTFR